MKFEIHWFQKRKNCSIAEGMPTERVTTEPARRTTPTET